MTHLPLKHIFLIVLSVLGGGAFLNLGSSFCFQNPAFGNTEKTSFYTIEDINVDVTEDSALVARDQALLEGQRKALFSLLARLSDRPTSFWEMSLKSLTEEDISNLVADFETTKEKSSPLRYIATLTYRFKKKGIDALLSKEGIAPQKLMIEPVLILPLLKVKDKTYLWEDENLWRYLWQEGSLTSSNIPLLVPLGDLEDIQSLEVFQALKEDFTALNAISDRYKATGGALVVMADLTPDPSLSTLKDGLPLKCSSVDITILGGLPSFEGSREILKIPSHPQESTRDLLDRALRDVLKSLNTAWSRNVLDPKMGRQDLSLNISLSSPTDWFFIRSALTNLKNQHVILNFSTQKITAHSISLLLSFRGDIEALVPRFKGEHLSIIKKEGLWSLQKIQDHTLSSQHTNVPAL